MESKNPTTVFVCSSPSDKDQCIELSTKLKGDGFIVRNTQEDFLPGQTRKVEVAKTLNSSCAILICLSEKSVTEEGLIQADIRIALNKAQLKPEGTIYLIPVLLEKVNLPLSLEEYVPANLFENNGYANLVKALKVNQGISEKEKKDMAEINELKEKMKEKIVHAREKELRFAVIGLTGTGKSSTINSLFGSEVAKVNAFEATTHSVEKYSNETQGIRYSIFDTPGLGESIDEKQNLEYVNLMKREIKEVDCVLYVAHLDAPRVTGEEKRAIQLFTRTFGENVWKHSVIVFTIKNNMTKEEFSNAITERTRLIRNEIYTFAKNNEIGTVPAIPISINSKLTPDGKEWSSELFLQIFERISDTSRLSFTVANAERIDNGEIPLSDKQKEGIWERLTQPESVNVIVKALTFWQIGGGAIAGGIMGGIPGAVIGAAFAYGLNRLTNPDKKS